MSSTIIRKKGSLTIPADIRKAARLDEGDVVEVEMTAEGILLRPKKLIDATQAWFWIPAWQAREREVDRHIERGEVIEAGDPEEFFEQLDASLKGP